MIAALDGNIIFIIVAAVVGIVNLFLDKNKKKDGAEPNRPTPERGPTSSNQPSEEERLRKFLEALGVPSPPPNAPPRPQSAPPVAPPPYRQPSPVIQPLPPARSPQPQRAQPQPVQKPRTRIPDPVPAKQKEPRRLVEPVGAVEQTRRDFDSHVMPSDMAFPEARGLERIATVAKTADASFEISSPSAVNIFKALRSRQNLRSLILLREILGPPPGLH